MKGRPGSRTSLRALLAPFALLFSFSPSWADPTLTPTPSLGEVKTGESIGISKPSQPPETAPEGPSAAPSESQGEKAPAQEKPSAIPQFSLPEVVITGRNELTIGAERPDTKEENITMGSRDLTNFDRSLDDLPGLNKTLTGLSTEDSGPGTDSALVLHYGGGYPGTQGGWALLGHDFGGTQFLLSGNRSSWGGESVPGGRTADERWGTEASLRTRLSPALKLLLSGGYTWRRSDLPYQGNRNESREGLEASGGLQWRITDLLQAEARVTHRSTRLDTWDGGMVQGVFWETEASVKVTADETGNFLNRVGLEAGFRKGDAEDLSSYDWGWLGAQGLFKKGEDLSLLVKVQAQAGSGPDLTPALFANLGLTWRIFEASQWTLSWGTDRYPESFQGVHAASLHTTFTGGFPKPLEDLGEWRTRFTQKLAETVVLSLSGSLGEWKDYHQWSDRDPLVPTHIRTYETLPKVRLVQTGGNLQWGFLKDWQFSAAYQWSKGEDLSGSGANFTDLPEHKGTLSLYRGDDLWEARLGVTGATTRSEFTSAPGTLPAYLSLDLNATYRLTKTLSLWFNGDNLLGADYEPQPGYPGPKYHVRAGMEVIF